MDELFFGFDNCLWDDICDEILVLFKDEGIVVVLVIYEFEEVLWMG